MNQKLMCAVLASVLLLALSSCRAQQPASNTADNTILSTESAPTELPTVPLDTLPNTEEPTVPSVDDVDSIDNELWAEDAQGNRLAVKLHFGAYTDTEGSVSAAEYNEQVAKLVIPAQYEGMTVVGIENDAFSYFPNLREVVLPFTVRSLSDRAFSNQIKRLTCSADLPLTETLLWNVEAFVLNDGCISAGQYQRMAHLTSLTITEEVSGMGVGAFEGCRSLQSVWIAGVPTVPYQAFFNCEALSSIVLGDGVRMIGDEAFSRCGNVRSFYLGKDFCEISPNGFHWTSVCSIEVSPLNPHITAKDIESLLWGK